VIAARSSATVSLRLVHFASRVFRLEAVVSVALSAGVCNSPIPTNHGHHFIEL